MTDKDLSRRCGRALLAEIRRDGTAHQCGQRQHAAPPHLAAPDRDGTGPPVDVIEREIGDFFGPQSELGQTQDHRIVAQASPLLLINPQKKLAKLGSRQWHGQCRTTRVPHSGDRMEQASIGHALEVKKPKKAAQRTGRSSRGARRAESCALGHERAHYAGS